jgi:hypothetical protein
MSIFKKISNYITALSFLLLLIVPVFVANIPVSSQIVLPNSGNLCGTGATSNAGTKCPGGVDTTKVTSSTTNQNAIFGFIITIAQWLTFIAGAVAALFMVIGGYYFISANGDEEKVTKGKETLIWASIGLATAILAYTIVTLISGFLAGNSLGDFLTASINTKTNPYQG